MSILKPTVTDKADEGARKWGSGNTSATYYVIEIRTTGNSPTVLRADDAGKAFVIDNVWRVWPIALTVGALHPSPSVPVRSWDRHAAEHGLLSYEAARAHQWAAFAAIDCLASPFCIQTRLVAVEFKETYALTEVGVSAPQSFMDDGRKEFQPRAVADKEHAAP